MPSNSAPKSDLIERIKQQFLSYLKTGINDDLEHEANRKIFMVNLFGFVGLTLTGAMGMLALYNQNFPLAAILLCACVFFYLGHYYQKRTGRFEFSASAILYSLIVLMIYLVYSGGVENTGPLWIFMVAPVALFFDGLKRGLIDILAFTAVIAVMMFYPNDLLLATSYPTEFKLRLIYSFLTITFLSAFYEYSRQQSFDFMVQMSHKYQQLAKLDPLTQLSNRRDAMDKLEYEERRIERNNYPIALVSLDIDFFKSINDTYGHDAGDFVLVKLSELFRTLIRKQDTVSRWGGEEFLFILPQTTAAQAYVVATKIKERIAETDFVYNDHQFDITVSMGISELNREKTIEESVNESDQFLYKAKEAGRNQIQPSELAESTA